MIDVLKMIESLRQESARSMPASTVGTVETRCAHALMMTGAVESLDELERRLKQAINSDYLGELFRTTYTVTGKGPFPIDMLRYTWSWPDGESDAHTIAESFDDYRDPRVRERDITVKLCKYHRDPTPSLNEDRWLAKFRWIVVQSQTQTRQL